MILTHGIACEQHQHFGHLGEQNGEEPNAQAGMMRRRAASRAGPCCRCA